jgi:hypothetical protein
MKSKFRRIRNCVDFEFSGGVGERRLPLAARWMRSRSLSAKNGFERKLTGAGSLPSNKAPRRLRDIIDNAQAIFRYAGRMEAFEKDRKTYDAVERRFEWIAEAAAKLGEMALLAPRPGSTAFHPRTRPRRFSADSNTAPQYRLPSVRIPDPCRCANSGAACRQMSWLRKTRQT